MLNIAMISGWHVHAKDYAHEIYSIPEVKITKVWDDNEARGRAWAEELNVSFESDLDRIFSSENIHAVVISSPTNCHKEHMLAAAKAGKHIFTEKVMAPLKRDCEEIAKEVSKAGIKFCISFPYRCRPDMLFVKQAVDEKLIGEVTLLRVRNAHNGASAGWLPEYFFDQESCGGGAMIDMGAHAMNLARWILGEPLSIISMFNSYSGLQVEDNAVSVIEFRNRALAVIEAGFVSSHSPYSVEVYGTEGSLLAGGPENRVLIRTNKLPAGNEGWIMQTKLPDSLPSPLRQWINSILNGERLYFGVEEGIFLSEIMEGAYYSYIEGKKIYLK